MKKTWHCCIWSHLTDVRSTMTRLGVSVLIKETWNRLCFGKTFPKPSWELSCWPKDDPHHATTVQLPTGISDKAGTYSRMSSKSTHAGVSFFGSHKKPTNFPAPPSNQDYYGMELSSPELLNVFSSRPTGWSGTGEEQLQKGNCSIITVKGDTCEIKMRPKKKWTLNYPSGDCLTLWNSISVTFPKPHYRKR